MNGLVRITPNRIGFKGFSLNYLTAYCTGRIVARQFSNFDLKEVVKLSVGGPNNPSALIVEAPRQRPSLIATLEDPSWRNVSLCLKRAGIDRIWLEGGTPRDAGRIFKIFLTTRFPGLPKALQRPDWKISVWDATLQSDWATSIESPLITSMHDLAEITREVLRFGRPNPDGDASSRYSTAAERKQREICLRSSSPSMRALAPDLDRPAPHEG